MPGARTIAEIVSSAAERDFVGRAEELGAIRDAARPADDRTLVLFLTGPGGIGKSRLLRAALGGLDERRPRPSCSTAARSSRRRRGSCARSAGRSACTPRPRTSRTSIALLAADGRPAVLALDTYERFGLLDTWLRQALLPRLPETVLTLVAGRDAPATAWMTTPGWAGLVRGAAARAPPPLRVDDAAARPRPRPSSRPPGRTASRAGHPLALELAAGAMLADPDLDIEAGPAAGRHRPAAARAARRAARAHHRDARGRLHLAPGDRAGPARAAGAPGRARRVRRPARACRSSSGRPDGLMIHDVVREAVAADLRDRDPELHRHLPPPCLVVLRDRGRAGRRPSASGPSPRTSST